MEYIHEQEAFLRNVSRGTIQGEPNPSALLPPVVQKPLPEEGPISLRVAGCRFPCPTA